MNPFIYGQIVSGEDFCPRPLLQKQIKEFIRSGQNILIQGERSVGKSSLICETVKTIKNKRLLYIDLLEVKSVDNLCKRIIKSIISLEQKTGFLEKALKIIAHLRPVFSIDPLTNQPTISLSQDLQLQPDSLEEIFDLIKKLNAEKSIVVVIDEFQDIQNIKESREILAILRGKIQFHSSLPYVFMGSIRNKMYEIFNNSESPFFKSAITIDVDGLSETTFKHYIKNKFSIGKRIISDKQIHTIFKIAENITGDVQQLCSAIWETTSFTDIIKDEHVGLAIQLIYSRESKSYESVIVNLTALQVKCLTGLAKMGGESPFSASFIKSIGGVLPASIKKSLTRLQQLKIIYRKKKVYKFINPYFKLWLTSNNLYT